MKCKPEEYSLLIFKDDTVKLLKTKIKVFNKNNSLKYEICWNKTRNIKFFVWPSTLNALYNLISISIENRKKDETTLSDIPIYINLSKDWQLMWYWINF